MRAYSGCSRAPGVRSHGGGYTCHTSVLLHASIPRPGGPAPVHTSARGTCSRGYLGPGDLLPWVPRPGRPAPVHPSARETCSRGYDLLNGTCSRATGYPLLGTCSRATDLTRSRGYLHTSARGCSQDCSFRSIRSQDCSFRSTCSRAYLHASARGTCFRAYLHTSARGACIPRHGGPAYLGTGDLHTSAHLHLHILCVPRHGGSGCITAPGSCPHGGLPCISIPTSY